MVLSFIFIIIIDTFVYHLHLYHVDFLLQCSLPLHPIPYFIFTLNVFKWCCVLHKGCLPHFPSPIMIMKLIPWILFEMWFKDQKHLETQKHCRTLVPIPDLLNQNLQVNKSSRCLYAKRTLGVTKLEYKSLVL